MRSASVVLGSLCVAAASSAADLKPALPWLPMHTHTEMMWTPSEQGLAKKPFFYDFISSRLRVDSFDLIGEGASESPLCQLRANRPSLTGLGEINASSYWLGNDLYIYDFGLAKTCQHLSMVRATLQAGYLATPSHLSLLSGRASA